MFNTLMYAKKLEEAGVSRPQAEAHVQIMAEIVEGNLATKQDMQEFRSGTKQDTVDFRNAIQQDLLEFQNNIQKSIGELHVQFQGLQSQCQGLQNQFQGLQNQFQGMRQEFQVLRGETQNTVQNIEYKIVIKLGAFIAAIATIAIGAVSLWLQYRSH